MKNKLLALSLSFLLLAVQNSFVFSQTSNESRSTDELVQILNEPDAVFVVNVKKTLVEVVPTLLNKDALLLGKLAATMKSIEAETGVSPYSLDKIVVGLHFDKTEESLMVVLQGDSANNLIEGIYRNQVSGAKLANEINPLKEKIFALKTRIESDSGLGDVEGEIPEIRANLENVISAADALQTALDALPITATNKTSIAAMKIDAAKIRKMLEAASEQFNREFTDQDFKSLIEKVEKQANDISQRDDQRASKIADLSKQTAQIDREYTDFYYASGDFKRLFKEKIGSLITDMLLEKPRVSLEKISAAEPRRMQTLRSVQRQLAALQKNLAAFAVETKKENLMPPPIAEESPVENIVYPISTIVTRQNEDLNGKKLIVIKTVKKFGGEREDTSDETVMLPLDEKTLLIGSRTALLAALENKSADRNRTTRDLIAKSGDALVAFGVDLQTVDLSDLAQVFGEQKNAWQVFGALTSSGNDLTIESTVEKTDRPLKLAVKPPDEIKKEKPEPTVADNDIFSGIIDLALKSVIGIEGKFTIRFEKNKAVTMLEQSPNLLRKMTLSQTIGKSKK